MAPPEIAELAIAGGSYEVNGEVVCMYSHLLIFTSYQAATGVSVQQVKPIVRKLF